MFVFDAPKQASLAVQGSDDRFPIRRIFCVGRNYEAHAREMGKDPTREAPFFFTKPADAAIDTPCAIAYPKLTNDLHHEIELVIAIGKGGSEIAEADVMQHVWGAAVGLDMTRRDLQSEAKQLGRPWDWGKAFDDSAPIGPIKRIAEVPSVERGRIWLAVNGELRQDADISDLIWSVREHISTLSHAMTLEAGDLVMTGTPAGVGSVVAGDVITGGVEGIGDLEVKIGPRA
ncbi:fumarylacetoacetate hydrolase family protein [Sulfitobacter sp. F26204]|uniref:fumarylacetoacetate hydrolase family protein n=1 Tax=Sulfitobacter sp. F26204 TaxID=2996014 RepID=UPI00225E54D7|nr:fumarylacetoacetate hydrolase family protein [Sulfitobacter sp. F26204]MCX7558183.1 fumarylacetoacetate hydrolase family protein [Sulfitobacter sp. F26204]